MSRLSNAALVFLGDFATVFAALSIIVAVRNDSVGWAIASIFGVAAAVTLRVRGFRE